MKITYAESGGFAGLTKTLDLETSTLPPEEAEQIKKWVDASRFFHLKTDSKKIFPDAIAYVLRVEEGGLKHEIHFYSGNMPKALEDLIHWVSGRAEYEK